MRTNVTTVMPVSQRALLSCAWTDPGKNCDELGKLLVAKIKALRAAGP